ALVSTRCHPACVVTCALLPILVAAAWAGAVPKKQPKDFSTVRWTEGQPGCTFVRGNDGKYRWGLWTDYLGITLTVDSQELQRTRRRLEPLFGVTLTLRYRGAGTLDLQPDK